MASTTKMTAKTAKTVAQIISITEGLNKVAAGLPDVKDVGQTWGERGVLAADDKAQLRAALRDLGAVTGRVYDKASRLYDGLK